MHHVARSSTLGPSLIVAASAIAWGCWWIALRAIDGFGLRGDWASLAVLAIAALGLAPFVARKRGWPGRAGRSVWWAGVFFGAMFATYQHALINGDVVRVTLLFYLAPVWGSLLSVLVLGARFSLLRVLVIGLGFSGAAVILDFSGGVPLPRGAGEWMGLVSGMTFAIGATFAHKVEGSFETEKTWLSFAFGAGFAALFAALNPVYPAPAVGQLVAALPFTAAAVMLVLVPITWTMVWGARRLDPGRVSLLLMFEVVAASVTATLIAGEPYGSEKLIGTAMILAAGAVDTVAARRMTAP